MGQAQAGSLFKALARPNPWARRKAGQVGPAKKRFFKI